MNLVSHMALADDGTSAGKDVPEPQPPEEAHSELVLRLGNESNARDGVFGHVTYGLRGAHRFAGGLARVAVYIVLQQAATPALSSVVNHAHRTIRFPELAVLKQPLTVGATASQNRTIDMYTTVGGVELTSAGVISLMLCLYMG